MKILKLLLENRFIGRFHFFLKFYKKFMKNLTLKEYFVDRKNIKKIIFKSTINQKDLFLVERWNQRIHALFPSFWKNHFSIPMIINSKALKGLVLDFGCGSGHLSIELAKMGLNLYGIDHSLIGIKIANYFKGQQNNRIRAKLTFNCIEIQNFKPDFKFDSCLISHVLEHLKAQQAKSIIKEIKRLLKKDAEIFITLPFAENFKDPDHCNIFYTLNEFEEFMTNIGLRVKKSYIEDTVINSIASCY